MGYTRMKEFMHRAVGIDVDKIDMDRLADLIGNKLNDLLVIGVRNAGYNNRVIMMEPDLPLTKGIFEHLQKSRRYEETIDLKPILDHLVTISITDESCPASFPEQGTGQSQQAQEIDGLFLIPDQAATTF